LSMGVWEYGSVGVWEYGSMGVWECGSMGVWECGSVGVWEYGSVEGNGNLEGLFKKGIREGEAPAEPGECGSGVCRGGFRMTAVGVLLSTRDLSFLHLPFSDPPRRTWAAAGASIRSKIGSAGLRASLASPAGRPLCKARRALQRGFGQNGLG